MSEPIADSELILYSYQEQLSPAQLERIAAALQQSASLRARFAELTRTLRLIEEQAEEADALRVPADLEQRVWRGIQARLAAAPVRRKHPLWLWSGAALAASMMIAVLLVVVAQRPTPSANAPSLFVADAGDRILANSVASHLDGVRELFALTQLGEDVAGQRALAQQLIDSNHTYRLAVRRAGQRELAFLLWDIEPTLQQLAQPATAPRAQLVAKIQQDDLVFRTGAAADILRARFNQPQLNLRGIRG